MSVQIIVGDCLESLRTLPDESVQMCVTSPPYFGLRDYQMPEQMGLESTPELYVEGMVSVFREVRRVLRNDGVLWLNIGDSYAANRSYQVPDSKHVDVGNSMGMRASDFGLKPKDLIGIPWLLAFALRADGWYLRSEIIWSKPNPMPESVTDRPTKSHEQIFLLAKSQKYFYDADAVAEPASENKPWGARSNGGDLDASRNDSGSPRLGVAALSSRNRRTVWTVTTQPYSGAHFATFPPKLIEPCILAGSSPQACEKCGSPWERVTDTAGRIRVREGSDTSGGSALEAAKGRHGTSSIFTTGEKAISITKGWKPTCDCENTGSARCVVLDPFFGAGTTGVVASRLNRDCIGLELNPEYVKIAEQRIYSDNPLFNQPEVA